MNNDQIKMLDYDVAYRFCLLNNFHQQVTNLVLTI